MNVAIVGSASPGRIPSGVTHVYLSDATAAKYPHFLTMPYVTPVVFDAHATMLPEQANPKRINIKRDHAWRNVLISMFGYRFSSTLCWMLAHSIEKATRLDYEDTVTIYMTGVRMHGRKEIALELSNISYLIGYAEANGIPVLIEPPSLLIPNHEYPIRREEDNEVDETDSVESTIDQSL